MGASAIASRTRSIVEGSSQKRCASGTLSSGGMPP